MLMSLAVFMLALPSAVLAFTSRTDTNVDDYQDNSAIPAGKGNSTFSSGLTAQGSGGAGLFRFTPAGMVLHPERAVTVAVRVDDETVRAITVHGAVNPTVFRKFSAELAYAAQPIPALHLTPSAYSLGVARGYDGFNQKLALAADSRKADISESLELKDSSSPSTARLAPHIALDERDKAGRAPRTLEANGRQTVDLGGSYALSRNLNLTAGVRYSQERDRLLPQNDGKKDSQAVFLGTQIRF